MAAERRVHPEPDRACEHAPLTEPHRQLIRILAEAAVEDYLAECETNTPTDHSQEEPGGVPMRVIEE